jgi:hypothetical protein
MRSIDRPRSDDPNPAATRSIDWTELSIEPVVLIAVRNARTSARRRSRRPRIRSAIEHAQLEREGGVGPAQEAMITLVAASGFELSESPASAPRARRGRWPFDVVKKLASGVPKCGVFIVVTLRSRGSHASVAAVAA